MGSYLNKRWTISGEGITVQQSKEALRIVNDTDEAGFLRLPIMKRPSRRWCFLDVEGTIDRRTAGPIYLVNEYDHVVGEASLNSTAFARIDPCGELALYIRVPGQCAFTLCKLDVKCTRNIRKVAENGYIDRALGSRAAIVVPAYPSPENKYPCAFVHARVKAYRDSGIDVDVICTSSPNGYGIYEFEGVTVLRAPMEKLGSLLAQRAYDVVFLHFFDEEYAAQVGGNGLGRTRFFLWSHNPETRYWEWPLFTTPYFTEPPALSDDQKKQFARRDEIVRDFNGKTNVSWVFISELQRKRAEELIGLEFERAHVIPNLVDEKRFAYHPKDPSLRTKVFCVRKFEDIATYAVDIDVATVLELSKRPCFERLEFDFFGDGPLFDTLLAPLRDFGNVHLHKHFLTHDEIADEHARHGIGLFATRFDSQGVSMCEAALSGLAVVSSDIDAANYFLPNDRGLLCETENPAAYADAIEHLVEDPDYFEQCSKACHDKVLSLCSREMTIDKEIALLKSSLLQTSDNSEMRTS